MKHQAENEIEYLLAHFTVEQLQDLAAAASTRELPRSKDKKHLLRNLRKIVAEDRLGLAAHRLEALIPFKHVYLYTYEVSDGLPTFELLTKRISERVGNLLDRFQPVSLSNQTLQPQCAVIDKERSRVSLKFCHAVSHFEWLETSPDNRRRVVYRQRHPVVVSFRADDKIATISFPGFTQGSGTPDSERISYLSISESATANVEELTGIKMHGVQLKGSIDALVNEQPAEVLDVHRNLNLAEGSASVRAGESGADVATIISKICGARISPSDLRLLISNEEAKDVALFWKKLGLFTRIRFEPSAPELLFIWKGSGSSSSSIEYVIGRLVRAKKANTNEAEVSQYLHELQVGDKVWVSGLMQRFSLTEDVALKLLSQAVAGKTLQPRFKIRTEQLLTDYSNEWRPSLLELPSTVVDENGVQVDVLNPSNIEVVYERIAIEH